MKLMKRLATAKPDDHADADGGQRADHSFAQLDQMVEERHGRAGFLLGARASGVRSGGAAVAISDSFGFVVWIRKSLAIRYRRFAAGRSMSLR